MTKTLSARDEVLLAALQLYQEGKEEFTEWDLTVTTWKLNNQRWGLRGYETDYPDHKRVMNEVMAKGNKRLLSLGLVDRVRTNTYSLTKAGLIQSQNIVGDKDSRERANYELFDVISKYLKNNAFTQFQKDPDKPKIWLHVASFYGLSASMKAHRAASKMNEFNQYLKQAEDAIKNLGDESIRRTSSGSHITNEDIGQLKQFHRQMLKRFRYQFEALLDEM